MNKRWVRVLVALFIGGALQEAVHISTGREVPGVLLISGIISYLLISGIVYYRNIWLLQREVDSDQKQNDDLLDDFK